MNIYLITIYFSSFYVPWGVQLAIVATSHHLSNFYYSFLVIQHNISVLLNLLWSKQLQLSFNFSNSSFLRQKFSFLTSLGTWFSLKSVLWFAFFFQKSRLLCCNLLWQLKQVERSFGLHSAARRKKVLNRWPETGDAQDSHQNGPTTGIAKEGLAVLFRDARAHGHHHYRPLASGEWEAFF